jgi:hypothetical protein
VFPCRDQTVMNDEVERVLDYGGGGPTPDLSIRISTGSYAGTVRKPQASPANK